MWVGVVTRPPIRFGHRRYSILASISAIAFTKKRNQLDLMKLHGRCRHQCRREASSVHMRFQLQVSKLQNSACRQVKSQILKYPPPHTHTRFQNGCVASKTYFLRCVLVTAPWVTGPKTRLGSRIKTFTPHCMCRLRGWTLLQLEQEARRRH